MLRTYLFVMLAVVGVVTLGGLAPDHAPVPVVVEPAAADPFCGPSEGCSPCLGVDPTQGIKNMFYYC